ncbi:IS3 family transposase [Streptomyces noursei]|uniref:IS3 family transposase n=1 Tax=Streptomyces noursei TaxID=1971 RepID=UPI003558E02A
MAHEITVIHTVSRHACGVPWIHTELRCLARRVNHKRVARLVRERGTQDAHRRRRRSPTAGRAPGEAGHLDSLTHCGLYRSGPATSGAPHRGCSHAAVRTFRAHARGHRAQGVTAAAP